MVFSASAPASMANSGFIFQQSWKQLFAIFGSLFLVYVSSQLPLERWREFAPYAVFVAAGFLALIRVGSLQKSANGNTNWIHLGPFDIQPSEFSKFFLILWTGFLIERHHKKPNKYFAITLIGGFAASLALVMLGKDLGSAFVIGLIMISMIWVSGLPARLVAWISGFGLLAVTYLVLSEPYRAKRFLAVLNPFADGTYKDAGWQPAHSIMALASGGVFGKGLGASQQKWGNLPEAHTDFIFSIIGEELGLLGTLTVILLLIVLVTSIIKISILSKDLLSRYVGIGIAAWISVQALINLGSATGIFPVVGVTLPFISYGGSSLGALAIAVGFVFGIAFRDPKLKSEINTAWPRQRR